MSSISSGGLSQLTPQQFSGFDSDTLSGKTADASSTQGGGSINFGGAAGTSMDDLTSSDTQNGGGEQMQQMSQLIMSMMQMMLQMMQQMMKGQQSGDSDSQSGGQPAASTGGAAAAPAASTGGEESAPATGTDAGTDAAATGTDGAATGSDAGSTGGAATGSTGGTTGSSDSSGVSTGDSTGLHLPDSMKSLDGALAKASKASGIDAATLAAQVYQESRGVSTASTVNGGNGGTDAGLMQVNENTFKELQQKYPDELGNADLSNPADNIMAGAMYMKDMKEQFGGNEGAALRGYNSGPLNVNTNDLSDISKYGTGDSTYVDKVQNFANIMKTGQGSLPA